MTSRSPATEADPDLLRRYLTQDDEAAFTALVERHLPLVYGTALRQLHDPTLAEEVSQAVFITLAKRAVLLTGHPSLAGWLYRSTLHLSRHEFRSESRRRKREQIANEMGTCMNPDDSLLKQLTPHLDEAMLELRSNDREALVLRFFGNRSIREVALALGLKEDAAQKRIAKALDRLTDIFRRRGFRVAGAAAVVAILQQSSAHAMPTALGMTVTKAVAAAGAKVAFPTLVSPIIKIMSLTKLQTAAICVFVAAAPLTWQWRQIATANQRLQQLNQNIKSLRGDVYDRERQQRFAEYRLAVAQADGGRKAGAIASSRPQTQNPSTPAQYLWQEGSAYVPIPKETLAHVRFAPFATRVARDGKVERYQLPPLAADGSPQPSLEAALGLSAEESQALSQLCQSRFADFNALAAGHSTLKEEPFAGGPSQSVWMKIPAFKEEGAKFRDDFRQQVVSILGQERADVFWQQATPVFDELFNGFGQYPRDLQLIYNTNGSLELLNSRPGHSTSIGLLAGRNGMPLPPALQLYANNWARQLAAQAQQKVQQ